MYQRETRKKERERERATVHLSKESREKDETCIKAAGDEATFEDKSGLL